MMAAFSSRNFDRTFYDKYETNANCLIKGASLNMYGPIQWYDKQQLVIKKIICADDQNSDVIKKDIEAKKQIWTSLDHKHLMRIHSVDISQLPKALRTVMEFAAGGSLYKALKALGSENKLPIDVVIDWTNQIAEGMLYLHEKNLVHSDLKASNILLMEPFDLPNLRKTMTLKITDLDDVKKHDHTTTVSFVETCAYSAPEVLLHEIFSKGSDVWSFGVLIWQMLSGDIPHKGLQATEIITKSKSGELDGLVIARSFLGEHKFILKNSWKSTSEERISFQQILDIPFPLDYSHPARRLITPEGEQLVLYGSDPVLVQTITKKSGFTYAMAILDNELFVVGLGVNSSVVEVYDSIEYGFSREVNLQDLDEPRDILSCSTNMCLYILHHKGSLFGILRIDSNGILLKKWSIGDDFVVTLSVTGEGNIIAAVRFKHKLIEYSSDGELIREVYLSQDTGFLHPACAIKLTSGDFVISHGDTLCSDDMHRVCIVDAGGKAKKSFGGVCGSTNEQLLNPSYLLVDSNGFVMVADYMSNRVLLLDSNLRFKREILTKEHHSLKGGMRILLDELTGRLFVVENLRKFEGRILIFYCQ